MKKKPESNVGRYQEFFSHLERLKRVPRAGWVRDRVPNPESVAEHSFKTALMAMVLADSLRIKVDKEKLVKMALIHDIGESIIGDVIQYKKSTGKVIPEIRVRKHKAELVAISKIFRTIPNGKSYIKLYKEFDAQKSREARIFNELDRLEMVFQALEYELRYGMKLDTYFKTGNREIHTKEFRSLFDDTVKNRKK